MRIIHIITRLIVGGAQENTIATVLGLRGKPGVEVFLVSGPTIGPEGSLQDRIDSIPGLLTIIDSLVRPVNPYKDIRAFFALTKFLREKKPLIVHTHSGKAGFIGRLAARRAGVPIIVHTIHGPSFGEFQGALPNFLYKTAERIAGRFTTHFISVAKAMTSQYLRAGIGSPEQYTCIYSGFKIEPFLNAKNNPELRKQLGIGESDIVIGKIARLFKLKGHNDLFAIAGKLVEQVPSVKFLLVGDGEWRQKFETLAVKLGLQRHFIFTGLVPPERIPSMIGIMDILVHLSKREGLARALPQALAAAKPVVAYDCDGTWEVCINNKTGFLIKPGDTTALVDALVRLSKNPDLRHKLGGNGRQLVKELFPEEKMVESIYNLYLKLSEGLTK